MAITYRIGTIADSEAVFQVFMKTIMDYGERMNVMAVTGGNDPEFLKSLWRKRKPLFEFLARDAAQFWVAEKGGRIIAYARSMEHDGLQELTEFFVLPDQQSGGVGRELLSRAFPKTEARYRTIIATFDERALYRYMKLGVYGRFPLKYFSRKAEKVEVETDLKIEPMQLEVHMEVINRIDREIVGHAREKSINGSGPRARDLSIDAVIKSSVMDMSVRAVVRLPCWTKTISQRCLPMPKAGWRRRTGILGLKRH
ncbi:MAG: hypothetical protein C3F07_14705 [Anaerolineales bacterium]|nr:MAG: hypothetical protein C3F07_14705 [Anaerolineales bacterium]